MIYEEKVRICIVFFENQKRMRYISISGSPAPFAGSEDCSSMQMVLLAEENRHEQKENMAKVVNSM